MDFLFSFDDVLSSPLASVALCLALIASYWHFKNIYSYWERRGVQGPPAVPFFGNTFKQMRTEALDLELDWVKKYGKVYGVYQGSKPRLVIADPEVLQQICIKDFDSFTDHEGFEFQNKYQREFMFGLKGDHWKKFRALVSPVFTSGKIKRMFKQLDHCADELVQYLTEQLPVATDEIDRTRVVNVREAYRSFTMDSITSCCYSMKLERAKAISPKTVASQEEFIQKYLKLFKIEYLRIIAVIILPKKILDYINFKVTPDKLIEPLVRWVKRLMEIRRNSTGKFDDYLQLLIDAKLGVKIELDELDVNKNQHTGLGSDLFLSNQTQAVDEVNQRLSDSGKRTKIELSDLEIISNAVFLIAVGLETTSNLLSSCSYTLAFHPNVQEKLYKELMRIVEFGGGDKKRITFNYESLTSCQYLDSVISETLRRLPPALRTDRKALKGCRIHSHNIDIPQGITCVISLYAIMNDPDFWDEPHKFDPERFMPGNREKIIPGAFCPFGIGPRHCLGMRFSLIEAKLALAKIVMNFRFEPAPGTKFPPESDSWIGLLALKKPVVKLVPRTDN